MSHISGLLSLQARSRRNALSAARLLRARRGERAEVELAVDAAEAAAATDRALRDPGVT